MALASPPPFDPSLTRHRHRPTIDLPVSPQSTRLLNDPSASTPTLSTFSRSTASSRSWQLRMPRRLSPPPFQPVFPPISVPSTSSPAPANFSASSLLTIASPRPEAFNDAHPFDMRFSSSPPSVGDSARPSAMRTSESSRPQLGRLDTHSLRDLRRGDGGGIASGQGAAKRDWGDQARAYASPSSNSRRPSAADAVSDAGFGGPPSDSFDSARSLLSARSRSRYRGIYDGSKSAPYPSPVPRLGAERPRGGGYAEPPSEVFSSTVGDGTTRTARDAHAERSSSSGSGSSSSLFGASKTTSTSLTSISASLPPVAMVTLRADEYAPKASEVKARKERERALRRSEGAQPQRAVERRGVYRGRGEEARGGEGPARERLLLGRARARTVPTWESEAPLRRPRRSRSRDRDRNRDGSASQEDEAIVFASADDSNRYEDARWGRRDRDGDRDRNRDSLEARLERQREREAAREQKLKRDKEREIWARLEKERKEEEERRARAERARAAHKRSQSQSQSQSQKHDHSRFQSRHDRPPSPSVHLERRRRDGQAGGTWDDQHAPREKAWESRSEGARLGRDHRRAASERHGRPQRDGRDGSETPAQRRAREREERYRRLNGSRDAVTDVLEAEDDVQDADDGVPLPAPSSSQGGETRAADAGKETSPASPVPHISTAPNTKDVGGESSTSTVLWNRVLASTTAAAQILSESAEKARLAYVARKEQQRKFGEEAAEAEAEADWGKEEEKASGGLEKVMAEYYAQMRDQGGEVPPWLREAGGAGGWGREDAMYGGDGGGARPGPVEGEQRRQGALRDNYDKFDNPSSSSSSPSTSGAANGGGPGRRRTGCGRCANRGAGRVRRGWSEDMTSAGHSRLGIGRVATVSGAAGEERRRMRPPPLPAGGGRGLPARPGASRAGGMI